jgi:histidinol-phosphate aminotransferase
MSVIKKHIQELSSYKPPIEGRRNNENLLLDFNERTVPVSPEIEQALCDLATGKLLQVYPSYGKLVERLAEHSKVAPECLMITNGSDQGIEVIIRACCSAGEEVIIPAPSFAMYSQAAGVENLKIVSPKYSIDGGYPTDEILKLANNNTSLIVASNPNNPTGTPIEIEEILVIAKSVPQAAILVDECYFEYTDVTVKDYVEQYPNLFICRTFSKTWGLPSLRLGTIISAAENIDHLLKVRGPYDVNQFAETAVTAAIANPSYMEVFVKEVLEESKPLLESFLKSKGIAFWPSVANFILTLPENPGEVSDKLASRNILTRPRVDPSGKAALRISIGTLEQTKRLISALEEIL